MPPYSPSVHREIMGRRDFIRLSAFCLSLYRLDKEGISGDIAEIGVFRGDTSVVLQAASPQRQLHLFDTFSGFPRDQLDVQLDDPRFDETSAAAVRRRLPRDARVTLHAGLVQESLESVRNDRFAFVLLDLDISRPTRFALDFLWPRMVEGAYLFVHDYHNSESNWAMQRTLAEFLTDKHERLVDLPDFWGSVVLRKQ